jgi:hypothetical protein
MPRFSGAVYSLFFVHYSQFETMKTKYLSYAQAKAICNDYKHLTGTPLDESNTIDLVTVAPYSRILQWQFLQWLIVEGRPLQKLLSMDYGGRYDVLAVTKTTGEPGFITKDLRSVLQLHNIPFDPVRYSCLRNRSLPQIGSKALTG